jgi:hypothetical protein
MTNVAGPFGLRPLRYRSGMPYNDAATLYYVPSTDGTALYIGDPVVKTAHGNAASYYGNPPGSLATVTLATAGMNSTTSGYPITGVVVGFFAEQATSPVYRPASTERGVYVADDPNLVFAVMDDGVVATDYTWTSANAGLNSSTYSGSAYTGLSGWTMSTATRYVASTTATSLAQLKILRLRPTANNAVGAYAVWEVVINQHTEGYGAGSVTTAGIILTGAPGIGT